MHNGIDYFSYLDKHLDKILMVVMLRFDRVVAFANNIIKSKRYYFTNIIL